MPELESKGISAPAIFVAKVCGLVKERATFVTDFWGLSSYFFLVPESYDEKAVKKFWNENTAEQMKALAAVLYDIAPFVIEEAEQAVHFWIETNGLKTGQVMNAFRLCVVGASMGPDMFTIVETIDREETLKRIYTAIEKLDRQ